jgi:hypothetical protein
MAPIAIFGIENDALNLAVNLLILFLVVIWLALVYWTYADARRRIIVRPPEYLEDVRERELEIQAAEARLQNLEHEHCQYCGFEVESDFLRCPSCLRRLKEPCSVCAKPLDPRWKICPYCEAEVGQAPPAEARRPRPRRAAAAGQARQGAPRPSAPRAARPPDAGTVERPARAQRERPPSAG